MVVEGCKDWTCPDSHDLIPLVRCTMTVLFHFGSRRKEATLRYEEFVREEGPIWWEEV